jgi:16S rRNA (cytosine967-C5)-methyltransferase
MDSAHYAVINSYVEIAKKKTDKFGANFVNAILRNVSRQKDTLLKNRKSKFFSDDFIKILKQDYKTNEIDEMEIFANIEPLLDLTLKPNKSATFDNGILLDFGTLRLPSNTKVTELNGFNEGDFWVQDASSSLAVKTLDNWQNKKVLDLCAAPGGKTAQLLSMGAIVTAIDISQSRLNILKENIKRLKLEENLKTICSDATTLECDDKFDVILIDAPCSATGTFRRHPEIIHTKKINDVIKMAKLQKEILENAINLLQPDGMIIYSTCSLSKLEGEKQVIQFIKNHNNFSIVPIDIKGTSSMLTKDGFLRILPQSLKKFSGTDGFLVACLQRKN